MVSSTLLVTLHGPRNTIDLELPGDVAIGQLLPLLFELCDEGNFDSQAGLLANAGLQVAGTHALLPSQKTLIDTGICNGMVLVLQTNASLSPQAENLASQQFGRRSVQARVNTGGIGVTWEALM